MDRTATSGFDCTVDVVAAVAHVSVRGVLDTPSAALLRRTVLGALADEPAAVLVDLAGVTDADPAAVLEFLALSRAAAAWPGAPLVPHSARPAVARQFADAALRRQVPLAADRAAAAAGASACPGAAHLTWDFTGDPWLTAARRRLRAFCRRHALTAASATGELVVTELLANAVNHGSAPITVRLSAYGRLLHLAVRDRGPELPRLRSPGLNGATSGRGLMIVDAVAVAWGAVPTRDGKIVWCSLGGSPTAAPEPTGVSSAACGSG